jgi:hypothetical protein
MFNISTGKISKRLNGWRRIAIVLCLLWICTALIITVQSYINKSSGYFVTIKKVVIPVKFDPFADIPIRKSLPPLPIGATKEPSADMDKVYDALRKADAVGDVEGAKKLSQYIESKSLPNGTRDVKQNSEWGSDDEVVGRLETEIEVNWIHFLFIGLALPLVFWVLAEIATATVKWVVSGFHNPPT